MVIDKENNNTFWVDAIKLEMVNLCLTFKKWEDGDVIESLKGKKLVGYQRIICHLIFHIKMDGKFTRKARFIAGGHTTNSPFSTTYSSVVSRDSIRMAFLIAALTGIDISACDIGSIYLNAKYREKIWTKASPEFGSDVGSGMIVEKALLLEF